MDHSQCPAESNWLHRRCEEKQAKQEDVIKESGEKTGTN